MNTQTSKVLIIAGGTGGHIMPGLAVAEALLQVGVACAWLGRRGGMEEELLKAYPTITYYAVSAQAFRGQSIWQRLIMPWSIFVSIRQSLRALSAFQPDVVCGFGGYVSAAGSIAAWLRRIPLVIHEQNKIPGITNRYLTRFASHVCESFPGTFHPRVGATHTGNPLRAAIQHLTLKSVCRLTTPLHIMILGGSQGAQIFNQVVPEALAEFIKTQPIQVRHQTGWAMQATVASYYSNLAITAVTAAFVTDMADWYQWADIVIARAGATTVAELMAVGVPSILIPYPNAADDHQTLNAQVLAKQGAAKMLRQADLTALTLANMLQSVATPSELTAMTMAARNLKLGNATQQFLQVLGIH